MRCGGPIAIVWCRMACDDELPLISLLRRPAKQRRRIGPLKVAENGVSAISPLSPFAPAKGFPASMAQKDAGAIAPARAVEERTVALRGFPETRRQWERCDLRGTRNRRRPSCCETLAPLTVLSPGPRLAGMPSRGRKIWETWGLAHGHAPLSSRMANNSQHATARSHKSLRIWRYLALFRHAPNSEPQFRKGLMKIRQQSRYTRAFGT
jgi:hypothetical protein